MSTPQCTGSAGKPYDAMGACEARDCPVHGKPAYTPGPWHACEDEPSIGAYRDGIACHIAACGMEQAHGHHIPLDEAYANSYLIAAAPELLEALKQTVGQFKFKWPSLPTEYRMWIAELSEQIEAAIAKAEGREP